MCVYNNQGKLIAWQEYLANLYRKKFRVTVKSNHSEIMHSGLRFAENKYKAVPFGFKKKNQPSKYSMRKPWLARGCSWL